MEGSNLEGTSRVSLTRVTRLQPISLAVFSPQFTTCILPRFENKTDHSLDRCRGPLHKLICRRFSRVIDPSSHKNPLADRVLHCINTLSTKPNQAPEVDVVNPNRPSALSWIFPDFFGSPEHRASGALPPAAVSRSPVLPRQDRFPSALYHVSIQAQASQDAFGILPSAFHIVSLEGNVAITIKGDGQATPQASTSTLTPLKSKHALKQVMAAVADSFVT
ncbi:hypothetical protein NM208_g6357 [Fusarium decemcellulare]|uniref:Uncharacterized protein n=1 Tax=Fusarium decemcellulare TaxID=57161 RepID=A0ACC1SDS1_9HYPO|nr:hypothetical protein NM208_g6357 [Fusarium decemcellulare]